MRLSSTFAIILAVAAYTSPALAGNFALSSGQPSVWQSTQCVPPTEPASLISADRESSGESMNVLIAQYNQYVQMVQSYMTCLSDESQRDANTSSETILRSAQSTIQEAQKNVDALGAQLTKK